MHRTTAARGGREANCRHSRDHFDLNSVWYGHCLYTEKKFFLSEASTVGWNEEPLCSLEIGLMVICVTRGSRCLPRWPWAGPCGGPAGPNGSAPKTRNVFWGRSSPGALLSVPAGLRPGAGYALKRQKRISLSISGFQCGLTWRSWHLGKC